MARLVTEEHRMFKYGRLDHPYYHVEFRVAPGEEVPPTYVYSNYRDDNVRVRWSNIPPGGEYEMESHMRERMEAHGEHKFTLFLLLCGRNKWYSLILDHEEVFKGEKIEVNNTPWIQWKARVTVGHMDVTKNFTSIDCTHDSSDFLIEHQITKERVWVNIARSRSYQSLADAFYASYYNDTLYVPESITNPPGT